MFFLTLCVFGTAFITVLVRREEIRTVLCAAMQCSHHFDRAESVKMIDAECEIEKKKGEKRLVGGRVRVGVNFGRACLFSRPLAWLAVDILFLQVWV